MLIHCCVPYSPIADAVRPWLPRLKEAKGRTLLVLVSGDGDYAGVVTQAQQEGFVVVIIAGADSSPRDAFLQLVPQRRAVVCWEQLVPTSRGDSHNPFHARALCLSQRPHPFPRKL